MRLFAISLTAAPKEVYSKFIILGEDSIYTQRRVRQLTYAFSTNVTLPIAKVSLLDADIVVLDDMPLYRH